jgi:tRNA-modifying protein YgfZ
VAILESMVLGEGSTLESEHRMLVEGCGLLDRSERGKLALNGPGAVEFLNGQVTHDVLALRAGTGCYAAFLTHKGKMLGDIRILAVGDSAGGASVELLLDTERVALQALFDMIRRFKVGYEVELHKRTLERSLLSLIGPRARALATAAVDGRRPGIELPEAEHSHLQAVIAGTPVRLISTTRPGGVDVLFDAEALKNVHGALLAAGATDVREDAAEILRVEQGIPCFGIDLDGSVIPQEAGLNERAVSFTKGCYVGQETVARLHYKGKPNRHLRGLRLSAQVEPGTELLLGERHAGRLTSSVLSPTFGPIGLGLLRHEAQIGAQLAVLESPATAEVVGLPFTSGSVRGR